MRLARNIAYWAGMLALLFVGGFALDWNENRSPWGVATQSAKLEILKKKLCN